jgi:hypothetical protein
MIARAPRPAVEAVTAAVEVLANFPNDPKFTTPTDAVGDWRVVREACFEHEDAPTAMKYAIEKLTIQLLNREPIDIAAPALRYSGTSGASGDPSTVLLELKAVGSGKYLYTLTSVRTTQKRCVDQARFTAECERRFAHWCARLRTVPADAVWPAAPREALKQIILGPIPAEEAAACIVEDRSPVAAVQREVLNDLRSGMGFFTANKEGGSHLFFDGHVFRRNNYGDVPNISESYTDDAAMLACLRRFYSWDAQRDAYPHTKSELDVWNYIRGQLQDR